MIIEQLKHSEAYYGFCQLAVFGCFIIELNIVKLNAENVRFDDFLKYGLRLSLIASLLTMLLVYIFPNDLFALMGPLMIFALGVGIVFAPLRRLAL
ncbi:MAG: hypothetical protein HOI53_02240 [Francisellaceae bacterium]|jgi:hypothetical protein|nr:hypothetical protein [Francisellaceae bacterium]MBT6206822.1 hypothetical protein [Francisellaceae bacterium]MBT6538813.1 hypothetical protein [Francisellaceae bacterium]